MPKKKPVSPVQRIRFHREVDGKVVPVKVTPKPKLSEMSDDELTAVSDEIERQARDRSLWTETEESKAKQPERQKWLDDNMTSVTIRMPNQMLELLRAAAAVEGIGYQTLMKKWLHQQLLQLAKERHTKKKDLAQSLREDAEEQREEQRDLLAHLVGG